MICKTFIFSRIEKTVSKIEEQINSYLKDHEFKYATQNESVVKGKFIVTVFAKKKANSTIRVKAFKSQDAKDIDKVTNEFLNKNGMKFVTQTFVGSNIYTLIFFDSKDSEKEDSTSTNMDDNGSNQN